VSLLISSFIEVLEGGIRKIVWRFVYFRTLSRWLLDPSFLRISFVIRFCYCFQVFDSFLKAVCLCVCVFLCVDNVFNVIGYFRFIHTRT